MEKIASFTVDHNKLEPGLYYSRRDGDIVTFDLREPSLHEIFVETVGRDADETA